MRLERKFSFGINVICPVQSLSQKYFCFTETQSRLYSPRPVPQRGVAQRHETRGGMRWTLVVPVTNGAKADAKSCGPDASAVGVKSAEAIPPATETRKPELRTELRGEHDISRKPSRAGMPGDPGGPVVTNSCAFFCTRGCGCIGRPAFPTPSWGRKMTQDPDAWRRGNAEVCPRSSNFVVPAKAGTHTPRPFFERRCSTAFAQQPTPVVMGPCFRRDDVERVGSQ